MTTTKSLAAWQSQNGSGQLSGFAYWPISGGSFMTVWQTESFAQSIPLVGVTFSHQSVYWVQSLAGATTLKFRVNGASGNQVCTGAGTGTVTDTTHSDAVSASALVNYRGDSAGDYQGNITDVQMAASTPYVITGAGPSQLQNGGGFASSNLFTNMLGDSSNAQSTASITNQQTVKQAGTASGFAVNLQSAPSGTVTGTFYQNGSAGNQTISTTGVTGPVQDATHTDAIASGNALNHTFACTNSTGNWAQWWFCFAGTLSVHPEVGSIQPRTASNSTWYAAFAGFIANTGTLVASNIPCPFGAKCNNLLYTADTTGGAGAVNFYNNSAAGNQTVSMTGTIGIHVDATHTDSVTAGNPFAAQVAPSSGSPDVSEIGFGLDDLSATGAMPFSWGQVMG